MENRNALRIKCHPQEWTRGLRRHWVRPPSAQRRAEIAQRQWPCDRRVSTGSAQAPRRCSSARTPWAGGLGPRPSRRGRTSRRDRRRARRHQRGRRCSRTMGGRDGWAVSAMLGKACGGQRAVGSTLPPCHCSTKVSASSSRRCWPGRWPSLSSWNAHAEAKRWETQMTTQLRKFTRTDQSRTTEKKPLQELEQRG